VRQTRQAARTAIVTDMWSVRFSPEHVVALERAVQTLHADIELCHRWDSTVPVGLQLAVDDLVELRDRMLAEQGVMVERAVRAL
jgi:hypothetical protein